MKKIPLFSVSILVAAFPLQAQYDDLLKNPDVGWVAEFTTDFSLDPLPDELNYLALSNDINIIQFSESPGVSGLFETRQNYEKYFSREIMNDIREGSFQFFADEPLENPLPFEKIQERMSAVDTVVTFDPETYEEKVKIVHGDLHWESTAGFRVRQVFYYNKASKTFGSRIIAVSPLMFPRNWEENMSNEPQPTVWLKIETPKNAEKITMKDVGYTFETKMRRNAPGLDEFVLKKGRMDFLQLIVNEVANPSHPVFDGDFKPIDPAHLQKYVLVTDTIVTYNPETFEERIDILQRNAIRDVTAISFVQHWYYDARKNLLFNRVVAIAPVMGRKEQGDFPHQQELFYILNR